VNFFQSTSRVAAVLTIAFGMLAYTDLTAQGQTRSVTVTGHGEAYGRPDQAVVSAGVQTFADTVIQATRENQSLIEKLLSALDEQGIAAEHIQTSNYSIWAEQDHQPRQVRIAGYRVSNIVTVKIDDIEKVGEVLAAVTNAGANAIHGVHFGVKDPAALEEKAQEAAMADARARAKALADLAGVQLGEVLTISTSPGPGFPEPMLARRSMEMADVAPVPSIAPGQQSLSVRVDVSFAIR
jgi:uncharacterized protein